MAKPPGGFLTALGIVWAALAAAGVLYARERGITLQAAAPVIAAFLIETPFYLLIGFDAVRRRVGELRPQTGRPIYFLLSAVFPYLACCCGAIPFEWTSVARLAAMALVLSFWYVMLPASGATDVGFLLLTGALIVSKYLEPVYPDYLKQHLVILGHITVIQIAVMALMLAPRVPDVRFGFWPDLREWRIGFLYFAGFLAIAFPLNLLLHATHRVPARPIWAVAAAFLGALWFQALSEEFLFRGALQTWMSGWAGSRTAGLLLTSAAFGGVHYWLRGWKWMILTAVLGLFCGHARNRTGGIRAGAVTHSLVIAAWRAFFW